MTLIRDDDSPILIGGYNENVGDDHERSVHDGSDLEESGHVHFVCVLCP